MNMNDFIEVLQEKKVPYAIDGDKIVVNGNLDLRDTSITSLPESLSVDGYLDLRRTGITSLPDNFSVGDGIDLRDTKIISLPNNLSVGHILCLQPENISNVAYRENCGKHNLTIFAARVNGGIRISADFSMRTLSDFEIVVDLKYLSKDAEDYKQAARDCVAELEQRRKGTGGSTKWLNVSDCLPELDAPVFGGWFSESGDFFWGCYVRTRFANSDGWVWATAEDFGKGDWLFGEDNPVEFWMPLPGKPELAGGAA